MALLISKEYPSGIVGSYWKIAKVVWEEPSVLKIYLAVYLSSTSRVAGKDPITVEVKESVLLPTDETAGTLLGALYFKLKQLPEFAGAIDV